MTQLEPISDAVAHVRKRKAIYLGSEDVAFENLATNLINDALTLGVRHVDVRHWGEWWLVSSEEDWLLRENQFSIEETFRRLVPLIGGGREALRREILLTAFAAAVFTRKNDEIIWILGGENADQMLLEYLTQIPQKHRVVGFSGIGAPLCPL